MTSNSYDWHTNALKGVRGPIQEDDPQTGWYENRRKDKRTGKVTRDLVAFWKDTNDGSQRIHINGRDPGPNANTDMLWVFASKYPISAEVYAEVLKTGKWPDDAKAVSDVAALETGEDLTPAEKIVREIAEARKDLPTYAKIDSDDTAAKAQSLRSLLTGLAGRLDKEREALVRPHIDAQREINGVWNPHIKAAQADAATVRAAQEAWETEKRVAARLAQEAADKLAREAAEAARKAEEQGKPPPPPPAPPPPSNAPAPSTQIKGGSGRAASVSTYQHVLSIDEDKVFAQFKGNPELSALLVALAQKAINAGIPVPGAVTEERAKVK